MSLGPVPHRAPGVLLSASGARRSKVIGRSGWGASAVGRELRDGSAKKKTRFPQEAGSGVNSQPPAVRPARRPFAAAGHRQLTRARLDLRPGRHADELFELL